MDTIKNVSSPEISKQWVSGEDLLKRASSEVPKLWEPYLPKTGLVAITGPSDCGKSSFARQLALSIVTGRNRFLGNKLNSTTQKVHLVCTEDSAEAIGSHLKTMKQARGITDPLDRLGFLFNFNSLYDELDRRLTVVPADLLVMDAWVDGFDGNINSPVDVRRDLEKYRRLAEKHNCLILIVHHNTKNSEKFSPDKNRVNGSQAIEAKMRCVMDLRKGTTDSERYLSITKCNYLPESAKKDSLVLQYQDSERTFVYAGKKLDKSAIAESIQIKKYDPSVWIPEMMRIKEPEKLSFEAAREKLLTLHANKEVPGVTWFKENYKGFNIPSDIKN